MEGNDCYKYRTVDRFVRDQNLPPIRTILEIGVNVATVTLEMHRLWPDARIVGYEAVESIFREAEHRTAGIPQIELFHAAVTASHLFGDNLGQYPRVEPVPLRAYLALSTGGPGWPGGSYVGPDGNCPHNYHKLPDEVTAVTLDEAVDGLSVETVDYLKCDCEGSEHSLLGCAATETLERIRFLAGEYHGLERFYPVVEKLRRTHYVSLIGGRRLGAFFAERISDGPTLLRKEPLPPRQYPHLADRPLCWHPFDKQHIPQAEWLIHGIT